MRCVGAVLLVIVFAASAWACGEQTTADAQAQLRSDLEAFKTALGDFQNLTPDSTMEDITAARESVQQAWGAVVESAKEVPDAKINDLQAAWDDLGTSVDDINSDMSVPEAVASVSDEVAAVKQAWEQLFSSLEE
jgi:hypothetical protein